MLLTKSRSSVSGNYVYFIAWHRHLCFLKTNGQRDSKVAPLDGIARAGRSVTNATLVLGPVAARGVSVSVGEKLPGKYDGLLGMTLLSKVDFILDVDQKRLVLIPIDTPATASAPPR